MSRRVSRVAGLMVAAGLVVAAGLSVAAGQQTDQRAPAQPAGWVLPEDAADKKNPSPVDEKMLATGKAVFKDKCQRCHGPSGIGDGPDADPDAMEDMDLTNPKRAEPNPDGVVFYKVMNGRRRPKMPAFKDELSEQQVWAVVAYVQTLRKK